MSTEVTAYCDECKQKIKDDMHYCSSCKNDWLNQVDDLKNEIKKMEAELNRVYDAIETWKESFGPGPEV